MKLLGALLGLLLNICTAQAMNPEVQECVTVAESMALGHVRDDGYLQCITIYSDVITKEECLDIANKIHLPSHKARLKLACATNIKDKTTALDCWEQVKTMAFPAREQGRITCIQTYQDTISLKDCLTIANDMIFLSRDATKGYCLNIKAQQMKKALTSKPASN